MARTRRQHLDALGRFREDLSTLLAFSDPLPGPFGTRPRLVPKPGQEQPWLAARVALDRSTTAAALACATSGALLDYKPSGTFATVPINPVGSWPTLLDPQPKFDVPQLNSCIERGIGFFESGLHRRGRLTPVRWGLNWATRGWVGTVTGGLVVAFLAFRFGWVG